MNRSLKVLGFLLVAVVGIWGCARSPGESGRPEKNPTLEGKVQRLEEDFRAAASARDQFRQQLRAAEEKQAELQQQLDRARADAAAERDALKAEIKTRTTERDVLASQYEGFRKNLKDLLSQAEGTLGVPASPTPPPTGVGAALRN